MATLFLLVAACRAASDAARVTALGVVIDVLGRLYADAPFESEGANATVCWLASESPTKAQTRADNLDVLEQVFMVANSASKNRL